MSETVSYPWQAKSTTYTQIIRCDDGSVWQVWPDHAEITVETWEDATPKPTTTVEDAIKGKPDA